MKYACTVNITYEVIIEAEDKEEAALIAFEALADDVTMGIIRTELFDNGEGKDMRFPMIDSVKAKAIDTKQRSRRERLPRCDGWR